MNRFPISTLAAGLALSMLGAPLSIAQSTHEGPQMSPHGDEVHATGPQHPVRHTSVEPAMAHGAPNNTMPHQMAQISHQQLRPATPMHATYGGHHWHHGDHYTGQRSYITNWQGHHLSAPPSGYRWVQDGGQFVLIAVASGVIADVIVNSAYQ